MNQQLVVQGMTRKFKDMGTINTIVAMAESELRKQTGYNIILIPQVVSEPEQFSHLTIRDIICNTLGYMTAEIIRSNRKREYADTRHIIAKIIRERCPLLSLKEIALCLGLSDHTSVISSIKRCNDLCTTEHEYRKKYEIACNAVDMAIRSKSIS